MDAIITSDNPANKKLVPCRCRGDVDNQLGVLHERLADVMKFYNVNISNTHYINDVHDTSIQYVKHQGHNNVFIANDVVPLSLARRVRDFLNAIPFDESKLLINDTDNQPQNKVFSLINPEGDPEHGLGTKTAYINGTVNVTSAKEWEWERYHSNFWRAIPITPEAFAGSQL